MSTNMLQVNRNPDYLNVFTFENYNYEYWYAWLNQNKLFAVYASAIYLVAIYYGQKFMRTKEPYSFPRCSAVWNFSLAILSLVMFFRLVPEVIEEVKSHGLHSSFCHFKHHNVVTSFWGLVFTFSRIVEFGETFFFVAAKKPISFLHWYHHVTVACYSFLVANSPDPSTRWFAVINSFMHSIMFTYFGVKAMGVKMPKIVPKFLTILLMSQMAFGLLLNAFTLVFRNDQIPCNRPYWTNLLAAVMYGSYLVLFAHFFFNAYIKHSFTSQYKNKEN